MTPKTPRTGIAKLREFFFRDLGLPSTLRGLDIPDKTCFITMAQKAVKPDSNTFVPVTADDILAIYESCF